MFRVSDQNGSHNRGFENDTYSTNSNSNSNSRRFKDSHDEMYGPPYGGRNKESHDHQGWNKSSKFDAYRDSDDDGFKSSGSKGYQNYNEKKKYGGFFGGSSKPKVLPPYQTVMLKVRTQCDECVRKVRKAIVHMDGVESISVDMNQKRITIKGNIDPQYVLKKATKTGKSVELVNSKGFGSNFPSYDQQNGGDGRFNASSDYYQQSTGDKYKQNSGLDNYQHSNGDKNKKSGNVQNSKGVKFNLTPDQHDRRDNGDQYQNGAAARSKKNSDYDQYTGDHYQNGAAARSKKNSDYDQYNGDQYQQGSAGKTKKNLDYDRYGSPDAHRSNSEQGQYSNGQRNRQDSDVYQRSNLERSSQKKDYDRQSSGERFSQKKDYERQSSGDRFRQNLTYPASRDEGSYMFSDENANSCSIM
ncbi:hypothetical protein O6H91_01G003900 [Diphasiastrum complanatum]|uniref:Uncharacterized protein n=1 Tax=Diphasiastrum complanatum TaxID=34168 RepID=A0ACC2EMJ9_DIPCM|nr:hypothetical protein O6H91_01G003900 [Diphasiastrum complanatum]